MLYAVLIVCLSEPKCHNPYCSKQYFLYVHYFCPFCFLVVCNNINSAHIANIIKHSNNGVKENPTSDLSSCVSISSLEENTLAFLISLALSCFAISPSERNSSMLSFRG